jgi:pimeloyl-ACP methyl ester carboxylesterase
LTDRGGDPSEEFRNKVIRAPLRFSYRVVNGVTLHVAEAGPEDGRVVVLLHGFPEFWYGWRHQFDALVDAGYRVLAPDQRGYNLSARPKGVAAYDLDVLGTTSSAWPMVSAFVNFLWSVTTGAA